MVYLSKSILRGEVEISGSKNAFFPAVGAGITLGAKKITIKNTPLVRDIYVMLKIIEELGGNFEIEGNKVSIYTEKIEPKLIDQETFSRIRGGVVIFGALLSRFGKAYIPYPGGCKIGKRPIDQHVKAAKDLGFYVEETEYGVKAYGEIKKNKISFDIKTVTGTENAILMSIRSSKEVEITNYAKEPEVQELIKYLEKYGVRFIKEEDKIIIDPTSKEEQEEVEFELIPDRIEAGTFLISAASTEGKVKIKNVIPEHLEIVIQKLKEAGAKIHISQSEIEVEGKPIYEPLYIVADSYPDFATDLQPQITVMLLKSKSKSVIEERVFPERVNHVFELRKMGAQIDISGNKIIIYPGKIYGGTSVEAKDLRSAASLVIAGLIAEGAPTFIRNFEIIERGYEKFLVKIQKLGAKFYKEIKEGIKDVPNFA